MKEGVEGRIPEAEGVGITKVRDIISIVFIVGRMNMIQRHVRSHGRMLGSYPNRATLLMYEAIRSIR